MTSPLVSSLRMRPSLSLVPRLLPLVTLLSLLPSALSTSYTFESDLTTTHTTWGLRYAGANFLSPPLLSWGVPANRVGGDDQTVYNPNTDTSNSDNDFFWSQLHVSHPPLLEPH
jgi:hypothetical protein